MFRNPEGLKGIYFLDPARGLGITGCLGCGGGGGGEGGTWGVGTWRKLREAFGVVGSTYIRPLNPPARRTSRWALDLEVRAPSRTL